MKVSTTLWLGIAATGLTAGVVACSGGAAEAPPQLELASDPQVEADTNLPKGSAPSGTNAPMGPSDAPVLVPNPSPSPLPGRSDGGARDLDAGTGAGANGADGGKVTDAGTGTTYNPRCNGYLSSDREHEANDTLATANPIVHVMCAGINTATDVDYYTFEANFPVQLTFDPDDDDAAISVKSPSGIVSSAQGPAIYRAGQIGRYYVAVSSPTHSTQTYLLVR
jgi:hypothetical protein